MKEVRKNLNTTKIQGRLDCANFLWEKEEKDTEYKKELEEEIRFLRRLLRYTDSFY
jgi:hypothetical protein